MKIEHVCQILHTALHGPGDEPCAFVLLTARRPVDGSPPQMNVSANVSGDVQKQFLQDALNPKPFPEAKNAVVGSEVPASEAK